MNENYLNKLEYNKILNLLSEYSTTYLGKELCLKLLPIFKESKVKKILQETSEASCLIARKGNIPISDISNIDLYIKNLESSYTLTAKGLLDIAKILKLSRELKEYFFDDENFDLSDFTILNEYFSSLYSNPKIENQILSSIIDEDNIADDASPLLSTLRRNRRKAESEIKENLNNIIHSSTYSKYIMEQLITIRNDRYVIPVKEEFRGNVKGFIHDVSASGSTVFIEPISVFELNNKINNIKMEEAIEIEKILAKLSALLFPIVTEISQDVRLIGILDFIFAKAKFAKSINAINPNINSEKFIVLNKARHPLIDKEKVVPIDIEIGKNYNSLIITGPNTGGKTVALKTVGLLTLMACSGLHIPADENSSIYVFDNVFADIGDEQSIQESLSTFSAHMLNIVDILNNVTSNSLVLLDELGSGTDPVEGASLATAILEHLNHIGLLTIATTHYQEIKNYALVTNGFENASSEFDIENLRPTYKLLIGIPGKSNAFSISKKLGLSNEILDKAKEFLKEDSINIEELLKNIYDNKIEIEKKKDEINKNLNQVESLRKKLEKETALNQNKETKYLEKAKIEAQNTILSAKDDANMAIKEIEEILDRWKVLDETNVDNLTDNEIADIVRSLKNSSISKANNLRNKLNNSLNTIYSNENKNQNSKISKNDLKLGMNVNLGSINSVATIVSLSGKSNQVQVQVGSIKMNVNISDIISINNTIEKKNTVNISSSVVKAKNVNTEINVIGQNIEEACFAIDKYLDDCSIAKLKTVRIVHGKGTGKLREGVHSFLRKNPHVKSFRLGTFGEGEMGVTVVELK
jgi:DNA mismatch repair protein MutS2